MKSFINVEDLGPLDKAMAEAFEIKNDRYKYQHLGKNKTLMMIFFNNSLRGSWRPSVASSWMATRASTCSRLSP